MNRRGLVRMLGGAKGGVLWQGKSWIDGQEVIVVATSVVPKGANANLKTGDVIQTWIVLRDVHPIEAVKAKSDQGICGDCKMRPQGEEMSRRACYVNMALVVRVWETFHGGGYADLRGSDSLAELFRGRKMRLGAYGDPVAVPHRVWESWTQHLDGWIGYTHAWRYAPAAFKRLVMASVDSPEERLAAKTGKYPWRTFRTRRLGEPVLPGEIECPADPTWWKPRAKKRALAGVPMKKPTTCKKCLLCDGMSSPFDERRDVSVRVHGWSPNVAAYGYARNNGSLPIWNPTFRDASFPE